MTSLLTAKMWMNVMETTGASMVVKTFWVDTDVDAHKDIFSITSGINVLVRKQRAQNTFNSKGVIMFIVTTARRGQE